MKTEELSNQDLYYPTVYKRSNCLFLLCRESLNNSTGQLFDYRLALYHGLVTRFPIKNTQALIDMRETIRILFVYERRRNATMVKIRHGLATLNSNYSVVYGQKHKVWVLVFLVRTSGTF